MMDSVVRNSECFGPLFPREVAMGGKVPIDLSEGNPTFPPEVYTDVARFAEYISGFLRSSGARLAYGGYRERRAMYARSPVFDAGGAAAEPRRIHMGLDFWGAEGTPVLAPADGIVHSAAMNAADGDYGATLVLKHEVGGSVFHTLYGHLSAKDLSRRVGSEVAKGELLARFGGLCENGNWPPHLHLQVVVDMGGRMGDYPGVCSDSELGFFLENCPDPSGFHTD